MRVEPPDVIPTGRRRHRLHRSLFGAPVLVLQIEEVVTGSYWSCGEIDEHNYHRWRDATPEDLLVEGAYAL